MELCKDLMEVIKPHIVCKINDPSLFISKQ